MRYRADLSRRAVNYYRRLRPAEKRRIDARIDQLVERPSDPTLSVLLRGTDGVRRSRVGGLRILFVVSHGEETIYVVDIGPRGDIYKS